MVVTHTLKGSRLTNEEWDRNLLELSQGLSSPEDYGALANGIDDDSAALEEALAAENGVLLNGTYRITRALAAIEMTSGVKRITGTGTIYVDGDVADAVKITSPYSTAVSISAINAVNHAFPGVGTTSLQATEIVAAGHGLAIGDLFKIYSEDQIPGAQAGKRIGEFAYVANVSGDNIYVGGRLQETYTTSPKLAKVNREPKLIWDGPGFSANNTVGDVASWETTFLTVGGFVQPKIRMSARFGSDVALLLHSTVQAQVDLDVYRMRNRVSSEGVSGYGLQDTCSFMSRATINGVDCRHMYTDITNSSGTSAFNYGRTRGAIISGHAIASSAAAWDTHSEGANITFLGCTSSNSYPGEDASGTGVQLRGRRNRAIGCTDFASLNGMQFYAQYDGDCEDCQLIDWSYNGARDALRFGGLFQVKRALVRGGQLRTSNNRAVYALNCDATLDDVTLIFTGSTAGTTAIVMGENAKLRIRRLTVDVTNFTGSNFRVFAFDPSTSVAPTLIVESAYVRGGAFQAWLNAGNNAGTATLAELSSDSSPTSGTSINAGSATVTVTNTAETLADHEARITALEP